MIKLSKIIGIDLGTSNSAAAVMMGGKPTIIPAAEGVTVGARHFHLLWHSQKTVHV